MMKEHWTLEAAFRKVHAVRREDSFNASFLVKALTAVSNLSLWSSLLFAYCTILHMFAIWCDSLVKILMWSPRSFIDLESQKPRCWAQKKKLNPALGEVPTSDFLWTTPACAGWFVQTGEMADENTKFHLQQKGFKPKSEPVNLEVMMTAPPDLCSSLATKNKRS